MILYAATVLLSASLLFLIQPIIAKIIFPWFGGSSAVWSAALVFFQICLLCGYAYAHWLSTRVRPRLQWRIHGALLIVACAFMPILPSDRWRPLTSGDPIAQILLLLAANVGLPSVLLSATSPLAQMWFMRLRRNEPPYWLFALSNFGSLVALLSFPLVFEPVFGSRTMAIAWSTLFVGFAVLCIAVAYRGRHDDTGASPEPRRFIARPPNIVQMASWVLFAACGSGLLVAATAQLSTNVAPIPLLWVVPLAVYLLTFILNFSHRRFYHRVYFLPALAAALGCMAWLYTHAETHQSIAYVIPLYLVCLFVVCMVCHGEIVHRSPPAESLTRFYLLIAFGGALGGVLVAVVAPLTFSTFFELPLLLIVIAELTIVTQWRRTGTRTRVWVVRAALLAGLAVLAGSLLFVELRTRAENLTVERNFYGLLQVRAYGSGDSARRSLVNGTIGHGWQYTSEAYRDVAVSYYAASTGVGMLLEALEAKGPIRYGVIGLGAGVLASYARAHDYVRLYEINPAVVSIANKWFSYLQRAKQRGADVAVELGDARLTLERQENQNFDALIVDAFSSDSIPVHLLTDEAMDVYFSHLKPDGVLAVHISNRYLDLTPVCQQAAAHAHRAATVIDNLPDEMANGSRWVLITSNQALLNDAQFAYADLRPIEARPAFRGWTDQYSSLWQVLRLR